MTNSAIISKGFAGRYGRGYLCHDVVNVELGRVQERNLLTGSGCPTRLVDGRVAYCSGFKLCGV